MKRVLIAALVVASVSASAQIIITPQTQTYGYRSWLITTPGSVAPGQTVLAPPSVSTFVLPDAPDRTLPALTGGIGFVPQQVQRLPDLASIDLTHMPVSTYVPTEKEQLDQAVTVGRIDRVAIYELNKRGFTTHQILAMLTAK